MSEAIGIRLEEDFLKKIEKLSKDEAIDRSTILRKLSLIGYKEFIKEKAAKDYMEEKMTISEAATLAGISIFDMEKYLINKGFVSKFSLEDLRKELELIR